MTIKRLLLIDDNQDCRTLVKFAIEMVSGWKVLTASNGMEGIAMAKIERPDVILLDFIMPDLDGMTVCKILKRNWLTRSIPIIFITAVAHQQVLSLLELTLAEGVIIKPFDTFDITELSSQISHVCNWELSE